MLSPLPQDSALQSNEKPFLHVNMLYSAHLPSLVTFQFYSFKFEFSMDSTVFGLTFCWTQKIEINNVDGIFFLCRIIQRPTFGFDLFSIISAFM